MTSTEPHSDLFSERADDPIDEALLLQAARDGSTAAFGILYARYRTLAVGIAGRALAPADAGLAEDVAEVAFLRVLTALRNGKGPADTLRAYLATVVRREAWRAQRRHRRQADVVGLWAADSERSVQPDPGPSPSTAAGLDAHVLLGEAFRGLSDRWRHVLWLTEVEGRKPAEVASMLGVSAGSASALAYRARHGLIAAYLAAYRRSTTDEGCAAIAGRLGRFVAAGAPVDQYPDVHAHLDGCAPCRDVSRGVDVLGTMLASFAPFGLLTAGWWAQTAGAGSAGLAGAAAVGAGAGAHAAGGSAAATATGSGVGLAGTVAAAAAVTVLAGATWFGLVRSDGGTPTAAAPPRAAAPLEPSVSSTPTRGADGTSPITATSPAGVTTAAAPAVATPVAATTPGDPASLPVEPTVPTTGPIAPATSAPPAPSTSAPLVTTSTTVVTPPDSPGRLSGRVTRVSPADPDVERLSLPVAGVDVVAYDDAGRLAATAVTDAEGRWVLRRLGPGLYLVVAVVPVAYRPASGVDPWTGGATWGTILGSVELGDQALDLVDLHLVDR